MEAFHIRLLWIAGIVDAYFGLGYVFTRVVI
jgi:hypothetical protein